MPVGIGCVSLRVAVHGGVMVAAMCMPCGAASQRPPVGNGAAALPGAERVGFAMPERPGADVTAALGYGFTESVLGMDDSHHRVDGQVAASIAPVDYFALGLELAGRYDRHHGGASEGEDGFVVGSLLLARATFAALPQLRLGGELGLRLPGGQGVSNGLAALGGEARVLLTHSVPDSPLSLSALAGYRLDRAKRGVDDPQRLSEGDRLALGASDWNSVLAGLAASYRLDGVDVLGECSWDVQVGRGAPGAFDSPLRLSAMLRYWFSDHLHGQLTVGASPSGRPARDGQLAIVEPRAWLRVGLGFYFPNAEAPTTVPAPAVAPGPAVVAPGRVVGQAQGPDGQPVPGLGVVLGQADETRQTTTDAAGAYRFDGVVAGRWDLRAQAGGYAPYQASLDVQSGGETAHVIRLTRALPEGVIRGTVRGYDGTPLPARVRIEPGELKLQADREGNFEAEVAPGHYTVTLELTGHHPQQRSVRVEEDGVTVILVELQGAR